MSQLTKFLYFAAGAVASMSGLPLGRGDFIRFAILLVLSLALLQIADRRAAR